MRILYLTAITLLLVGCQSQPTSQAPPDGNVRTKFENAIARQLLGEARQAAEYENTERFAVLRKKLRQIDSSVDRSVLSSRVRLELAILEYLVSSEEKLVYSNDYLAKLNARTSLDWSLEDYRDNLEAEQSRLDQTIAVLANSRNDPSFSLATHLIRIKDGAHYPADTFAARQQYLDKLSQAMITAQADWHDVLQTYAKSELAILGEEENQRSFVIREKELVIDLTETLDLPEFELESLAIFYGFPGLQAINHQTHADSLRTMLNLPAYNHGWAAYILEYIALRSKAASLDHLYLLQLFNALAIADLNIHTGRSTESQSIQRIAESTAYHPHRITLMLQEVRRNPGFYPSVISGKLQFENLRNRCIAAANQCGPEFHQRIVDEGPVPFELLSRDLLKLPD